MGRPIRILCLVQLGLFGLALAGPRPVAAGDPPSTDQEIVELVLTQEACASITAHVPDDTVAYRAGVDADGRRVAPADLPVDNRLDLTEEDVAIALRIPVSAFADIPDALAPVIGDARIDVGDLTFRDGVAYLGDRTLGDSASHAIAEACADILSRVR